MENKKKSPIIFFSHPAAPPGFFLSGLRNNSGEEPSQMFLLPRGGSSDLEVQDNLFGPPVPFTLLGHMTVKFEALGNKQAFFKIIQNSKSTKWFPSLFRLEASHFLVTF